MRMQMSRTLLRIIRLLLVIAGVTVVLWAITWHDAVRIPANGSGPAGNVSETVRSIRITDVKPVGSVLMSGVVVPPDATAQSPQVFQFDKEWYRPGILTTFSKASPVLLLTGLILLIGVYPLQATRWWLLMRCRGLNVGWFRTLRLVFIGAFFNFCLPGTEGGDIVKAWYVSRKSEDRVTAVMSVVFDRVTGLLGLLILAALAGVLMATSDSIAFTIGLWACLAIMVIALLSGLYFIGGLRSWPRLDRLQSMIGGGLLGRIENAVHGYGSHRVSVAAAITVSVVVQILLALAATTAGLSLGMDHDLGVILAIVPVLFLAAAIPMTWQGVGVMEALGIVLLAAPGLATPNQIIGMLIIYRGYELIWSLFGAALLMKGDVQLHPERDNVLLQAENGVETPE